MTVYHSSDFGWKSGQDVSAQFKLLVQNTFKAGDTFVLDHMYEVTGSNLQLPDDFTLAAVKGGGFDVVDFATNRDPLLLLGHGNKLDNITITHSDAPDTGYGGNNPARGVDFHDKKTIASYGKNDVVIESSRFEGNVNVFFDIHGGDDLTVINSHFDGGAYQMRWLNGTTGFVVESSLFQNALIDGIKTTRGSDGSGTERVTINNSVFENGRDGIDVTGGFKDSVVSNTIFRNNSITGIDIKSFAETSGQLGSSSNSNIRIENSQFIDQGSGIAFTATNRTGTPLTASEYDNWVPQDIFISDSIFERTPDRAAGMNAFLIKDGQNIQWSGIQLLGDINEYRVVDKSPEDPDNPSDTLWPDGWQPYDIGGTSTAGPARAASDGYPFVAGPVEGGELTSPAQAPADPAPEPEPAPSPAPAPDPAPSPEPALSEKFALWLIDAATDRRVAPIEDGAKLDAALLGAGGYSIEVVADPSLGVQSVRMTLGGKTQTESVAPFALFGDANGDFAGMAVPDGPQTIRVELFSGKSAGGTRLGDTSVGFEIADAPPAPVNLAPAAFDDAAVTDEDAAVTVDVLANDGDPEGDALTLSLDSGPSNGTAEIRDGRIVYTPDAGFFGTDDFVYRATDAGGLSDTANVTVAVAVNEVPDAPEPQEDFMAPFDTSGDAFDFGTVKLFGFGVDGGGASIGVSGGRIGVGDVGSASEIDFRSEPGGGEMIGIDFGAAVEAMTVLIATLGKVGDAKEAGLVRTYDDAGDELEMYLLTDGNEFNLSFDAPVRYATLQASDWVDGRDPGTDPDIGLIGIDADYIL